MKTKNLSARATIKDLLERYSLRADKAFGQNFLVDEHALNKIVLSAELNKEDNVLEVGPGLGVLTAALAKTGADVTSVELDERLIPVLAETVGHLANVTIVQQDALEFDLEVLPKDSILVANLPYNVATPIIMRSLKSGRFKRLVFLVQKEVAQRFTAVPSTKAYGALTVVMQYFGDAIRVADVKGGSFMPPPDVTSSIVLIDVKPNVPNNSAFIDFIHQTFRYRRKTLRKNLQMMGFNEPIVTEALHKLNLGVTLRAEALALKDFERLFELLDKP